ncbi:MAG: hypothetical protein SOW08_01675 [Lachnospiraceae bacterium]|nr:hypothetical protein [Lachnospiraceae bacterium]
MDKNFTINGTVYAAKNLDFGNLMCDLEDRGVNIIGLMQGGNNYILSFCRGLISVITGLSTKDSGKLLAKHLASGGELTEMTGIIGELMAEDGFGAAGQAESESDIEAE